jgi:ATP-binding cassette, subfamily B, bacterial
MILGRQPNLPGLQAQALSGLVPTMPCPQPVDDYASYPQVNLAPVCGSVGWAVPRFGSPNATLTVLKPQKRFLFSGTVLDNIRFGRPEATRAEVEAAARAVGAHQVIAGLPDGYDTQVGERGALLAAGERQLVAFARAWIADPALLILDEATSNVDAASEARITDALQRLRSGRTTIIIAHRLSTIAQADQIAVVEDGRLVESGTPAELRARGGRFAELFDRWLAGAA